MNLEKQPKPESDLVERRSGEINIVQPPHKPEPEKPSGKGMKTTVMAGVAVLLIAIIAFAWINGSSDSEPATTDSVETVGSEEIIEMPAEIEHEDSAAPPVYSPVAEDSPETAEQPAANIINDSEDNNQVKSDGQVTTPLGTFHGKTSGNKPSGMGTITVSRAVTVTDFKTGENITLRPGDEIRRAKFVDGSFVQGELWRNGSKVTLVGGGSI